MLGFLESTSSCCRRIQQFKSRSLHENASRITETNSTNLWIWVYGFEIGDEQGAVPAFGGFDSPDST